MWPGMALILTETYQRCTYLVDKERFTEMQSDFNTPNMSSALDQVLSTLSFPIDKDEIIQHAQMVGANQQVVSAMKQMLPEDTFRSVEEVKKVIRNKQPRM